MAVRSVIFDFDGTILDTEVPDFQSWKEVLESYGCALPLSEWSACIGTGAPVFDPYSFLEEQVGGPVDRERVREFRRLRYMAMVEAEGILPGVMQWITDARRLGIAAGVASSSSRAWVSGHLDRLGLSDYFALIRCRDDVPSTKPEPDLYLTALDALGVGPHEAIALEDSPNGILAANRAGIFAVAIPNPMTQSLPLNHANLRLPSLLEMSLEEVAAFVAWSQQAGASVSAMAYA